MNWRPSNRVIQQYRRAILGAMNNPASSAFAQRAAQNMMEKVLTDNTRTWRVAATKNNQGLLIRKMLKSSGRVGSLIQTTVQQNVDLIQQVARSSAEGSGESQKRGPSRMLRYRADLIARTEVGKANTALIKARSQEVGAGFYIWRTGEDYRVRPAHRVMNNVICKFNENPAPELLAGQKPLEINAHYGPGEVYNCRCYPESLLRLDQTSWPAKVYSNGKIRYTTLATFKKQLSRQELIA